MDSRYQDLLTKIEAKTAELNTAHVDELNCKKGCHGCCLPGLSVFPVEAAAINEYILAQNKAQELLQLEAAQPHQGQRCSFLGAEGGCQIYPVRPVICRTHGLPLRVKAEDGRIKRDSCPLNFTGRSLDSLAEGTVLNLDLINTLLVLINSNFLDGQERERLPLKASQILATTF